MIDNNLDLTSLRKVVKSFETSLNVFENFAGSKNEIEVIKAGVIQNFKFCYELSWKFIKRWLMMIADRVFNIAKKFLPYTKFLLKNLEAKNDWYFK